MDTLQVVMVHMDVLKSCLTWRPSPVQEMKSMQTGKNVIVVYTVFKEDSCGCGIITLLLPCMYK